MRHALRLLAASLAIALASCAPTTRGGSGNSGTTPGEFRWTGGQDIDSLNPILTNEAVVTDLSEFTQGYFFNFGPNNRLVPSLSLVEPTRENHLISADGRTVTYRLRHGVLWHDGVPFTSADVAFSVKTILDPRVNTSSTDGFIAISRVETPDPYTVVVHLKYPYAPFVTRFFTAGVGSGLLPKHLLAGKDINHAAYNGLPNGLGPYEYVRWRRGDEVVMRAFPKYWGGRPKMRRLTYRIIPDANTALNELRSHELDAFVRVPDEEYPVAANIPGSRTINYDTTGFEHIAFNFRVPVLRDRRVREAIAHALDRVTIREKVTHGTGYLTCSPIPHFEWAYDPHTPCYDFNLQKAAALLDQAGWKVGPGGVRSKNGVPLQLTIVSTAGDPSRDQIALLLQSSLQKIGVELSYRRYPANELFAKRTGILDAGKFDLALFTWFWAPDPDISSNFTCSQAAPVGQNEGHYCNPQVDRLLDDALRHYDIPRRRADYFKVQALLARDLPVLVVYQRVDHLTANVGVKGLNPTPAAPFWNAFDISI